MTRKFSWAFLVSAVSCFGYNMLGYSMLGYNNHSVDDSDPNPRKTDPLGSMRGLVACLRLFCVLILLWPITGCDDFSRQSEKRARAAAEVEAEEILLAIVDSSSSPSLFTQGVALAIEEFNDERIIKQKLIAQYYDDRSKAPKARSLARKLAGNENVVAVIGHLSSATAIAASIVYERAGVVLITPSATQSRLIRQESRFTFRNIPTDEVFGREAARYVERHQYKKVAIIYDQELATRRLAELFHKAADDAGIEVVAVRFYSNWETDYRELITKLVKDVGFDALFLSGILPQGAEMIKQLRAMGVQAPIISGIGLDSYRLMDVAGKAAENTTVATVFNPKRPRNLTRDFIRHFKERYGIEPDTWAAQGYDAVKLLTHAMVESGSRIPAVLASTLRFVENWEGVTGKYSMTLNGDVLGKEIYFKTLKNKIFAFQKRPGKKVDPFETIEEETLRIGVKQGEIHLDPCHVREGMSAELAEQLFLGLTDIDPDDLKPVPALATSWIKSNQGKTYRFHLRKDARWTNGRPVTAHDVAWAVRRNVLPATGCWEVDLLFALENGRTIHAGKGDPTQLGVKVIDDYTIEFDLERPIHFFPRMLNRFVYRPLPTPTIKDFGKSWTHPERIVTNGAYRLAAWEPNMLMALKRNDDYYDSAKVHIPEIRYFFLRSQAMGLTLYRSGKLDALGGNNYLPISSDGYASIRTDKALYAQLSEFPLFKSYGYGFRLHRFPMNNLLVRKAITAALDRDMIVELIAHPHETSATFTPIRLLPTIDSELASGLDAELGIPFNPNQANLWLAEAGYPEGRGFPEITLLHEDESYHRRLAQAVKASLEFYLKLNVELLTYPPEEDRGRALMRLDPHLFQLDWTAAYPHANNFIESNFHPGARYSHTGWWDNLFIRLLASAQSESSPEIRAELFRWAERMITYGGCAVAPIYSERTRMLVHPRITNWRHMPFGGQYLRDWRFRETSIKIQ
uniref:ABC-type oligopeptide transport system, substrate-binding protein n=1 Tax=Candidatus Kentrum sp. UNK TaxID=2126344 RepID=A0A451B4E8_9GAMM|nr:MAG: ABC-type oligopeptide transport system, substrate-binding protein [Candidatus Kentron sp. UNK]VFK73168.1 MAG: ABC-type oligopeptide transport system, substrate-binding protein [Candidatus Kentron sp. UNK]